MNFKIAVHDFVAVEGVPPSRAVLRLDQGRDLVFACLSANRWTTPQTTTDSTVFTLHRERLYQYRVSPPPLATGRRPISIPEWGQLAHANDPDQLRLQDLQEFESTDFQTSPVHLRVGAAAGLFRQGKRMQGGAVDMHEPVKRPRLESILDLIPQPHFIPYPAAQFWAINTSKIPPYQKALPSPISPYAAATVDELLNCSFRRAAWLIPVRGSLPWDGASDAVILEETQVASRSQTPCLPVPAAQPRTITWTPDSLQHLWSFLRSIQQAKHLGPISLSFHAVSADADLAADGISEPVWESNYPYSHQLSSKLAGGSPDDFATDICVAQLEDIDHIKVFHDIPYCLSLRNILDAYRYEPVNGELPGRSGANDRKIRILKGAHLVLMDERSKAAFWM